MTQQPTTWPDPDKLYVNRQQTVFDLVSPTAADVAASLLRCFTLNREWRPIDAAALQWDVISHWRRSRTFGGRFKRKLLSIISFGRFSLDARIFGQTLAKLDSDGYIEITQHDSIYKVGATDKFVTSLQRRPASIGTTTDDTNPQA